tara:strand:- start:545 stop:1108 length:564 start_codon:yes stop_codon:yes gene_type:complete
MVELKDYIRCYDGLFEDSFCKSTIETFNNSAFEYTDREQKPSFNEFNVSQRYLAKDSTWEPVQRTLTNTFCDAVDMYMQELGVSADFPAEYAFEEHRIKMYQNNQYDQFKDHVDVQDYNSARRFLVLFLYLNTVTEGGSTYFPRLDYSIQPECGRILVFPATWQYRHAGRPPVSDKKYIVGSYLHYL